MFEQAQSYPYQPQSDLYDEPDIPVSSESPKYVARCCTPNCIWSPSDESFVPDADPSLTSNEAILPAGSAVEPPLDSVKQGSSPEYDAANEYELFQANMTPGQPYITPFSSFEELPTFPRVNCLNLQSGFSCGNGTSGVLNQGVVVKDQTESSNLEGSGDMKVKQEAYAVAVQRLSKPQKLTEDVIKTSPFPPNLEPPAILGGKMPPRSFKKKTKKHVYTERELKSRQKKGLTDDSDSESEERRQVRLPRRSLLTITTAQMSQYANFLKTNLGLTPSQQDELSKQKRLVKNRESAGRFRAKKVLSLIEYRDRVMELEGDIVTLRAENERLRKALLEATSLTQQNLQAP